MVISETQIWILITDQLQRFHKLPDILGQFLRASAFLFGEGPELTSNLKKKKKKKMSMAKG